MRLNNAMLLHIYSKITESRVNLIDIGNDFISVQNIGLPCLESLVAMTDVYYSTFVLLIIFILFNIYTQ